MSNTADSRNSKPSKLDAFALGFEYNQTITEARKSTRLRALQK
jgi:hypothetical protein